MHIDRRTKCNHAASVTQSCVTTDVAHPQSISVRRRLTTIRRIDRSLSEQRKTLFRDQTALWQCAAIEQDAHVSRPVRPPRTPPSPPLYRLRATALQPMDH